MKDDALCSGQTLAGNYTLIRRLSASSPAEVWQARARYGGTVACKILSGDVRHQSQGLADLTREAEVLSRLDHPSVPQLVEFRTEERFPFLATKYSEGATLRSVLAEQHRSESYFSSDDVRSVFGQLRDAIEYMHHHCVVHRDIQTRNITVLERRDGLCVKVHDFAYAQRLDAPGLEAMTVDCTPDFSSGGRPSNNGQPYAVQGDIFGLGAILFELLTGEPAFEDCDPHLPMAVMSDVIAAHSGDLECPPGIRQLRPGLSAVLESIIARVLSADLEDRPSTVAELNASVWPELTTLSEPDEVASPSMTSAAERLFDELGVEPGVELDTERGRRGNWLLRGVGPEDLDRYIETDVEMGVVSADNSTVDDHDEDYSELVLVEPYEANATGDRRREVSEASAGPRNNLKAVVSGPGVPNADVLKVGRLSVSDGSVAIPPLAEPPSLNPSSPYRADSPLPVGTIAPTALVPPPGAAPNRTRAQIFLRSADRIDMAWAAFSLALGLAGIVLGLRWPTPAPSRPLPQIQFADQSDGLEAEVSAWLRAMRTHPTNVLIREEVRSFIREETKQRISIEAKRADIDRLLLGRIEDVKPADLQAAAQLLLQRASGGLD